MKRAAFPLYRSEKKPKMSKISETTRVVKVTDFVPEPPAILVSETITGPSGRSRLWTQKIQVTDSDLWDRLNTLVRKGDMIQVTVKTIWPDHGNYYTCLADFQLTLAVPSAALTMAAV